MLYPDFNELISLKYVRPHLTLASSRSVRATNVGDYNSPFRGQGLEFDTVREYIPGDDIRNIDWRVTARKGFPHMKLFKEERERDVLVCVDMNTSMQFGTKKTFKSVQAARVASLLGWKGLLSHDKVGGCLFGQVPEGMQFFTPNHTRKVFWAMLKMMTRPYTYEKKVSLLDMLQHLNKAARTGALIYIISDFIELSQEIEAPLNRLKKRCDVVFVAVNDPADKKILPIETVGFHSKEIVFVNTDSSIGRQAYAKQWEENRKLFYNISSRIKVAIIEISTESDVLRKLMLGLKQVQRGRKR